MKLLLATSIMAISMPLLALNCPTEQSNDPNSRYYEVVECENGLVSVVTEYFRPTGSITGKDVFSNGLIETEDAYNIEGDHTYRAIYEHISEGRFIKTVFSPKNEMQLVSKEQLKYVDEWEEIVEKVWKLKRGSNKIDAIQYMDTKENRPYKVEVFDQDESIYKIFELEYFDVPETNKHISKLTSYNGLGELNGVFEESSDLNIPNIIQKSVGSAEAQRRIAINQDSSRTPVVIIDTGFDLNDSRVNYKLWNNPKDPMDGIDNDLNGYVDDTFGWHEQDDAGLGLDISTNNINETLFVTHFPYPVSHGTHVASIAMSDIENYGLVGFAGDVANVAHLKHIGEFLKDTKVPFVNMSFAIGNPNDPTSFADRDAFFYLEKMIKDNPETVFIVAAGNSRPGLNLDNPENNSFPASYNYPNMIVVGATQYDDLFYESLMQSERAYFSKFGDNSVHLFAPGSKMEASDVGGGTIKLSGTSMAAPFVTNILMKVANANPKLTPLQVRKIVLDTVTIPEIPLPCSTQGVINPDRAIEVAKGMLQ